MEGDGDGGVLEHIQGNHFFQNTSFTSALFVMGLH